MKKFDFDFYKNRKILFGISIGLMVIGLISISFVARRWTFSSSAVQ